ncbi:hypothetical protein PINS_up013268 [Pythium insidiosum]|nr:hypothetical protein PINS_up013268 [Pythium insidiosum]
MDTDVVSCCSPCYCAPTQETPSSTTTATTALSDDDSPPSRQQGGDRNQESHDHERRNEQEQDEQESDRFGFVARLLREYSLKRAVSQLIAKKQQQLREMQALIVRYQSGLQRCIKGF